MMSNLVNIFSKVFTQGASSVSAPTKKLESNPFSSNSRNPFVSYSSSSSFYGKNQPVKGGYYAGYYNGKPNIVGKKLFIEV